MKKLIYFTLFIFLFSCSKEAKILTKNNPHFGSESREDSLIWERDHAQTDSLRVKANVEILAYLGCDNADTNQIYIDDLSRLANVKGSSYAKGILLQEIGKNEICKLNNKASIEKHFEAIELFKKHKMFEPVLDNYQYVIDILGTTKSLDSMDLIIDQLRDYSESENLKKGIAICKFSEAQLASFRSEYDKAIALANESISYAEEIDYFNCIANSYIIISTSYNVLGNSDSSLAYLYKSLNVCLENDFDAALKTSALIRNNIGTTYYRMGELDSCIAYYNASLEIAERLDIKKGIATLSNNLGLLNKRKGNLKDALVYYRKAVNINTRIGNKSGIGTANTNIGVTYKDLGEFEMALEYYKKAYTIFHEMDSPTRIAILSNSIGSVYKDLGYKDSAMFYYRKAEKINTKIKSNTSLAITLGNIGSLLVEMDSMQKAEVYLYKSWDILKETKSKQPLAQVLMNLAKVESKKKNYAKAKVFLAEAYEINRKLNSLKIKKINAERLYWINFETGNYKDALVYYKEYVQTSEELMGKEQQKELMQFELQREYDQKTFADSVQSHNEKEVTNAQLAEQDA